MKKTTLVLSIVAIIIGICFSECAIGQNKKQLRSQIEVLEKTNESQEKEIAALKEELKEKTDELKVIKLGSNQNNTKVTEKYPKEIDELLNIEDTTIFNVKFKQFEKQSVHPRSREMYLWVSNIHELNNLLCQIEKNHLSIENTDPANLPPQIIKKLESLNISIKENIRTADKLRNNIESSYNDMKKIFSREQMNYYNGLVAKLNRYINIYFE